MDIVGIDSIVLGVAEMEAAQAFVRDFGLIEVERAANGASYECLDGTRVVLHHSTDAALRAAVVPESTVREIIWGVRSEEVLRQIASELEKDRHVTGLSEGIVKTVDDDGYGLSFQVTKRRPYDAEPFLANAAGTPPSRPLNTRVNLFYAGKPRSIGHIVLHTPDAAKSVAFYTRRLGFRLSDSFKEGHGAFLRAAGSNDHHTLFLFRFGQPLGLHHINFHMRDFNEIMVVGMRLLKRGWKSALGPGRHIIGSNYFWYFATPCGGEMELSCDIDQVDDRWKPQEWDFSPANLAAWQLSYDGRSE